MGDGEGEARARGRRENAARRNRMQHDAAPISRAVLPT